MSVRVPSGAPDRATASLPSTTFVVGPYGDVVALDNGELYLSWYPAGRLGWSRSERPPAWPAILPDETAIEVSADIVRGLARVLPGVARVGEYGGLSVRGGSIFALGSTDVDDPASGFHQRHQVGPWSHGGYHTVDTGKTTLAPMFALQVADSIDGATRG